MICVLFVRYCLELKSKKMIVEEIQANPVAKDRYNCEVVNKKLIWKLNYEIELCEIFFCCHVVFKFYEKILMEVSVTHTQWCVTVYECRSIFCLALLSVKWFFSMCPSAAFKDQQAGIWNICHKVNQEQDWDAPVWERADYVGCKRWRLGGER